MAFTKIFIILEIFACSMLTFSTHLGLPGESQGRGSLVGCHLWGRTESDTTNATWQQQQVVNMLIAYGKSAVLSHSVVSNSL